MVTINDIASRAGVSAATVSRYLNKPLDELLSSEKGKLIYSLAQELGYKRLDQVNKQFLFAVVHKESHFKDSIDNGYYYSIRDGIETEAALFGDKIAYIPLESAKSERLEIDGAIIIGNYKREDLSKLLDNLNTKNIICVGRLNFSPDYLDTVTYDINSCVSIALDALRENGNREFIFVDGRDIYDIPTVYRKIVSVKSYVERFPEMKLEAYLESDGYGSAAGYEAMRGYLESGKPLPKAIFAATDPLAIGISRAIGEKLGKFQGVDYSLISINGDDAGRWLSPPLYSVFFESNEMGTEAVRMLHENIKRGEHKTKCVFFPARLIKGGSLKGQTDNAL